MTAWDQPGFDFDSLTLPVPEIFQCEACGAIEPDQYNMGKHGGIADRGGYLHCMRMSNTEAVMNTYIRLFITPDGSHCCTFRDNLGHPRDQEPTRAWRREHYEYAYQEAAKTWSRASTRFHMRLLEYAMRVGFNRYLTERLFKHSQIPYAPSRNTFESPYCQLVEERGWWIHHVGTLVGDHVECTCKKHFTPDHWQYHVAGYPAPTLKDHQ
ncbi:hypothetical protein [Timonella senegalensis]|uniref:hypothetical protein n=1 Tax=Timonella senegalensis TaxID=1465825 RepID=UPI0028ABD8AC|nr:hypothetical protein [Timonella senegalensis]